MEKFIKTNYPEAVEGKELTRHIIQKLTHEFDYDMTKTLLATSVCSDEIIRSATNFRDYLENRSPFQLGGLAGYPFAGLTGLKAFAAHIPDNGFAIILYGPHIGVSKNGEIGITQRQGQMLESTCCGALQASLATLFEEDSSGSDAEMDYQMWKIEQQLGSGTDTFLKHNIPLVAVTDGMYEVIHHQIQNLMKVSASSFTNKKVALVGGVIINTDFNLPDWFDLRQFKVIDF